MYIPKEISLTVYTVQCYGVIYRPQHLKTTADVVQCSLFIGTIEEETDRKEGNRSSLLFGGRNSINPMPQYRFTTRMILKKRMNRTKATWRNGCVEKMDDHPFHHTIPCTILPKWMFSQKLLLKSSLLRNS